MRTHPRMAPALGVALVATGMSGCVSQDWAKVPQSVSVSAANYSEVSGEDLYARVNAEKNEHASVAAPAEPTRPLFYAIVPGEIYASDVPLESIYRELAVPLAHRGYFNVVYQVNAGLKPNRIDYLFRVHCGVRGWGTPTVRTDKVTWGDDGLVTTWSGVNPVSANFIGPDSIDDSERSGLTPIDMIALRNHYPEAAELAFYEHRNASDTALIMVEAFKFDDVWHRGKNAPCIWATFIAVKLHPGQKFSDVLVSMARSATPYFGTTTTGLQVHDLPPGNVLVGNPVEVPGPPK